MTCKTTPTSVAPPISSVQVFAQCALRRRDALDRLLNHLRPMAALLARVYVAQVFFSIWWPHSCSGTVCGERGGGYFAL